MGEAAAEGDLSGPLADDLRRRMRTTHGFRVVEIRPLATGHANNNRLLRLRAADGRTALTKVYYRDALRRLETEYGALDFLSRRGMARIPRPYLRCDAHDYAVYSFEPGAIVPAAALTEPAAAELARFAADLHRFRPGDDAETDQKDRRDREGQQGAADAGPRRAQHARLSFAAQETALRRRLETVLAYATSPAADERVRRLVSERDIPGEIDRLIRGALEGLDPDDVIREVPADRLRLNHSDLAPHNVLVRPDGGVCVVDFEFFGWDDPDATVACFLANGASLDLRPSVRARFLDTYSALAPEPLTPRFPRVLALLHVAWCLVHLSLMTADQIARKRFASPDLDVPAHLADQTAQLLRRLEIAGA